MSERMIELHRARLLGAAAGKGGSSTLGSMPSGGMNGGQSSSRGFAQGGGLSSAVGGSSSAAAAAAPLTPQQAALHAMRQEDQRVQRFLQRLSHSGGSASTVPPALSRRILHRQGVQYRDPSIACIISGAADRFLSTVLQQATACRDQRLKGQQVAKEAARHRKRHREQYELDVEERRRRRQELLKQREDGYLATIEAAGASLKAPASAAAASSGTGTDKDTADTASKKKYRKKAAPADASAVAASGNGKKRGSGDEDELDEELYDSLDEEEDYYQKYYADDIHNARSSGKFNDEDDDDEEENDMLILRDLARPLEGWDFYVTGKEGMDPNLQDASEDEQDWADEDESDLEMDEDEGNAASSRGVDMSDGDRFVGAASKPGTPEKKNADASSKMLSPSLKPAGGSLSNPTAAGSATT